MCLILAQQGLLDLLRRGWLSGQEVDNGCVCAPCLEAGGGLLPPEKALLGFHCTVLIGLIFTDNYR